MAGYGDSKKQWTAGSAVPDLNYPQKNGLAHLLHAPDRENPKVGCTAGFKKAAKMVGCETWARSQQTQAGKPGCEAFNRPEVWLS